MFAILLLKYSNLISRPGPICYRLISRGEAAGMSPGPSMNLAPFMAHWISQGRGPCSWFEMITQALDIQ